MQLIRIDVDGGTRLGGPSLGGVRLAPWPCSGTSVVGILASKAASKLSGESDRGSRWLRAWRSLPALSRCPGERGVCPRGMPAWVGVGEVDVGDVTLKVHPRLARIRADIISPSHKPPASRILRPRRSYTGRLSCDACHPPSRPNALVMCIEAASARKHVNVLVLDMHVPVDRTPLISDPFCTLINLQGTQFLLIPPQVVFFDSVLI